jgi:hypothetical protein
MFFAMPGLGSKIVFFKKTETTSRRPCRLAGRNFLFYMTGLTHADAKAGYMRFMPLTRQASIDEPRKGENCTECSLDPQSRFGRGILGPRLPTFHHA